MATGKWQNYPVLVICLNSSLAELTAIHPNKSPGLDIKVYEFITSNKNSDEFKLSQVQPKHLIQHVLVISTPIVDLEDTFCWCLIGNAEFPTKSATWKAHNTLLPNQLP